MYVLENKRLEPQAKTFKDRITEKIAAFHTKSKKKNEDGGGKIWAKLLATAAE